MTGIIYKITNTKNGKIYIGQTVKSLQHRWLQHINAAKHNNGFKLGRAMRKYTSSVFTIETIVTDVPDYFLDAFEKFWIHHYDAFNKGYNSNAGGKGNKGRKASDSTKALMSRQRKGVLPWNTGLTGCFTKEVILKMRKAKEGKSPTNLEQLRLLAKERTGAAHQNAKPANVYSYIDNTLIAEGVILNTWCKANGYNMGNLSATARGKVKHTKNIYAVYQKDLKC